jgi:hypothetical protein
MRGQRAATRRASEATPAPAPTGRKRGRPAKKTE